MTSTDSDAEAKPGRLYYLIPREELTEERGDIDLPKLASLLLDGKWLVILVTSIFLMAGLAYALLATERYRAEVLPIPADDGAARGLTAQFGGLAQLAGLNLGSADISEQLAVLKSEGFARSFIEREDLLRIILHDEWDETRNEWRGSPENWPDVRDAVRIFDNDIRFVVHDRKTGIVTLAIEWHDPATAAAWANLMATRINEQMRARAVDDAEDNIAFLTAELARTDLVVIQQAIGRLLEFELQKLMLARGSSEYAFRIVDSAQVPKRRVSPQRTIIVALSACAGLIISILLLVLRDRWRSSQSAAGPGDSRTKRKVSEHG